MKKSFYTSLFPVLLLLFLSILSCNRKKTADELDKPEVKTVSPEKKAEKRNIDTVDYNKRILALSNQDTSGRWPVKSVYPLAGAVLPYNRIVAFYGNLYSKRMGILGELPKEAMLKKLNEEVAQWQEADPNTPVIPALHYIAITAQSSPGKSNQYRMRMPFKQIDTILSWAKPIEALVFLDVQVGHSTIKEEVATLEKYLSLPNVHLGIDPEFSLKNGEIPGTKIGTYSAEDINTAIDYLAAIVRKNKLPPKVLVVHRFTQRMLTNYKNIKKVPEVQVVINMDGFGSKILKKSTYVDYIYREPVQFTGFKLFYKNDTRNNPNGMYTPAEILKLKPKPIYIQYQ